MDINYYTFLSTNTTQYRPGVIGDIENEYVQMWEVEGEELIEGVFDWERTFWLFYYIVKIFPSCNIRINDVLFDLMEDEVVQKYGYDIWLPVWSKTSTDNGTVYNHHHHAHIRLDDEIDWSFKFGENQ